MVSNKGNSCLPNPLHITKAIKKVRYHFTKKNGAKFTYNAAVNKVYIVNTTNTFCAERVKFTFLIIAYTIESTNKIMTQGSAGFVKCALTNKDALAAWMIKQKRKR